MTRSRVKFRAGTENVIGASALGYADKVLHQAGQFAVSQAQNNLYRATGVGGLSDPESGAGTTALVANKHGRRAVLVELNPDYAELTIKRLGRGKDTLALAA